MVLRKTRVGGKEGKFADMTLLKVKNEMEERHNVILKRNRVQYKYIHKSN